MKTFYKSFWRVIPFFTILISSLFTEKCVSQFYWQNPLPQGNKLNQVQFINSNTGFTIGDAGTFMKTTNGGLNWNSSFIIGGYSSNWYHAPNNISSFHAFNELNILVATNDANVKMMKTSNGGISWDTLYTIADPISLIYFVNNTTGYAFYGISSGYGKIYKCTDSGSTWNLINSSFDYITSCYFINSETGWATGNYFVYPDYSAYIYKTTNGGINWSSQLYSSSPNYSMNTIWFINANTGFVGGTNLWKTTNSGINWTNQNISSNSIKFINSSVGFSVNNNNLYKTTNTGENWFINWTLNGNNIGILDSMNLFIVGDYGNLYKSSNEGDYWKKLSQNVINDAGYTDYTENILYSIIFLDKNTGYSCWAGGNIFYPRGGILKTTNSGIHWNQIHYDSLHYLDKLYFINSTLGWVYVDSILKKTSNGGNNWSYVNLSPSSSNENIRSIFFINENTGWVIKDSSNKYLTLKTINSGENWSIINNTNSICNEFLCDLYFLNELTGIMIESGRTSITTNGGNIWQNFINTYSINASCRNNNNDLYAIGFQAFYKSTNYGVNWQLISNPVIGSYNCISMINSNTGYIAGLSGNFSKTIDGGLNWINQNSMSGGLIRSISTIDTNFWIAGDNGMIISNTVPGIIGISNINNYVPDKFLLSQNYPNPFNPNTKINYELPKDGRVKLVIYDILGREIKTLVNELKQAGRYTVEFNGNNYASGVYFYRIQVEGGKSYTSVKKMVMIK
jgi:photosystem II stability/assembly factor-like uncharacterized protein